jgi:sugar transferase (PEP-CTERM/EpsH1 system associated)
MRILCLTSRFPYPPNRGDRLRAYHFITQLAKSHEIHLASFIAHPAERDNLSSIKPQCKLVQAVELSPLKSALTVGTNIWRTLPLQALYYRSAKMLHLINELLDTYRYDVIYVHLFRMAQYVSKRNDIYRILDLTDVISRELSLSLPHRDPISRLLYTLEGPRIQRYEQQIAQNFDEVWMISEPDRSLLASRCPIANIHVIPNGVDTNIFYPINEPSEPKTLIFTGHMGVAHNIDAAIYLSEQIFPLVQHTIPDCKLMIVGAEPGPAIQQLSKIPGLIVTGYVSDLNLYLNKAAVFVAPLRFAAGIQNKVLEAMASARPVVTTSIVNESIGAKPGWEIFIADDARSIANHVIRLINDMQLQASVGKAAMNFVKQRYNWSQVLDRMEFIHSSLHPDKIRAI